MGQNFIRPDRDQLFLMPADMRDWLPEDDLAWLVVDAVEQIDVSVFRRAYRGDGQGRAAFDPAMMVALLLYSYCHGVRSSREVERRCVRDVAFRVIAGGLRPDHATIARFRARHEAALQTVFTEILRLCARAGMVRLALLAVDGTKVAADASWSANRTFEQLEADLADATAAMLAQAAATDAERTPDSAPNEAMNYPSRCAPAPAVSHGSPKRGIGSLPNSRKATMPSKPSWTRGRPAATRSCEAAANQPPRPRRAACTADRRGEPTPPTRRRAPCDRRTPSSSATTPKRS